MPVISALAQEAGGPEVESGAGDVLQFVECLSSMETALSFGPQYMFIMEALGQWRQESQKFKNFL